MWIEALKPLTVKLPAGDLQLKPGFPVNLAEDRALKLLAKATGKVRMVQPHALAFQLRDLISWQTWDGKIHGPALVEHVTFSGGRRWAWVTWDGMKRAVSEALITAVEPLAVPPTPCRLCGTDSWWRAGAAEAWQCRRCHPLVRVPGYEVLGPYGKLGDAVRTQARADTEAWLATWRELAAITDGITADDPRFQPVMAALEQCDTAYLAGDWPAFQRAALQVREVVQDGEDGSST